MKVGHSYYPCFTDDESEAQGASASLPEITQSSQKKTGFASKQSCSRNWML